MSDKIVDIEKERLDRSPHLVGKAICINCNHQWTAIAPVDTKWMECPECHLMRGHYFHHAAAPEEYLYTCECGNQLFMVTASGMWCPNCAVYLQIDGDSLHT